LEPTFGNRKCEHVPYGAARFQPLTHHVASSAILPLDGRKSLALRSAAWQRRLEARRSMLVSAARLRQESSEMQLSVSHLGAIKR
jgi:hypothetical protein